MVTPPTIIRRRSTLHILRDIKRQQVETSKTGIHPNAVVNEAIDEIERSQTGSGNGTAPGSTTVPYLLKKRREIAQRGDDEGEGNNRSSSTKK